ncbi:hypothetical protein GOEFS_119_00230 [Gordonia effusa NBRC 100432]|uniref:DUF8176 domain-containing protein n=1 Tax=Gordonia effusa NBRC 100432 TaxID=1077974 RepID=H0R632_9ACTN|nr:hypothetical protein [Gordonia effusa]GAB20533.1 hypothetical protein GOEFS_119_00230 [Gordonia effusa NBRC 100432]
MSTPTAEHTVTITITSTTTAQSSDGVTFESLTTGDLQHDVLDYARHLAATAGHDLAVALVNEGNSDTLWVTPEGVIELASSPEPDQEYESDQPPQSSTYAAPVPYDAGENDASDELVAPYADDAASEIPETRFSPSQASIDIDDPDEEQPPPEVAHPDAVPHYAPAPPSVDEAVPEVPRREHEPRPRTALANDTGPAEQRRHPSSNDSRWRTAEVTPVPEYNDDYYFDDVDNDDVSPVPTRSRSVPPQRKRGAGPHVPLLVSRRSRLMSTLSDHKRTIAVAVLTAVAVGSVTAGAISMLSDGASDHSAHTDPVATLSAPTIPQADPTSDAAECPSKTSGATTTGRLPGNQASGVGVIQAFDFAYYQWRNAEAAHALVLPKTKIVGASDMQQAIDFLAPDVRYCLTMTAKGRDLFEVALREISPTGQPRLFRQNIQTQNVNGRYFISSITKPPATPVKPR